MNPIKYFFKQSKYALNDFNQRIDSKGRGYIKDSIRKAEIAKLSPDDSLVFEFQNKGKFIELTDNNIQSYMISEFPQIIYPNWLYDLVNYGEPIVISQFMKPLDSQKHYRDYETGLLTFPLNSMRKLIKGRCTQLILNKRLQMQEVLRIRLLEVLKKLYSMSMYLKLSQENSSKLLKSDKALKDLSYAKQIKLHQLVYKQKQGLETFLPNATDTVGEEFYLTSSNVSSSLPFTTATLNDPDGIFYGITLGGEKIRFDRFSKASKNYNGIIFATSGAGKSFSAKLEAYRSLFRGINVYVIDPEGEFKTLCDYVGGTNIDINPESKTKVNPLQFFSSDTDTKEVMRTHLGVVKGLLKIWLSEDAYNRGIVSKAVNETYASKGILLDDPTTYSKKPPTISDLIKVFEKQGDDGKRIAVELLEYSHKGEMGDLYDNPSTDDVNFNSPMVVFNIQKVPDQEKQASIFYLSNFIWQKVLSNRNRKVLIIDEVHLLLKDESSANFIENLVRRGRKYNLGVISISQDVDDFLKSPQGSVIAKNADTALILAQKKQSIPSLVKAFDLSDIERDYITRLTKGQALFIKGNTHSHMFVYATPHERKLFSSNAEDLAKIDEQRKNGQ